MSSPVPISSSSSAGASTDQLHTLRSPTTPSYHHQSVIAFSSPSNNAAPASLPSTPPQSVYNDDDTGDITMASPSTNSPSLNAATAGSAAASASAGATASSSAAGKVSAADVPIQILTKPRLQELVREIDPTEQLDEEVEELLLQIADDFVENTVNAACLLAKHRKVSKVEVKDVQLHLGECARANGFRLGSILSLLSLFLG